MRAADPAQALDVPSSLTLDDALHLVRRCSQQLSQCLQHREQHMAHRYLLQDSCARQPSRPCWLCAAGAEAQQLPAAAEGAAAQLQRQLALKHPGAGQGRGHAQGKSSKTFLTGVTPDKHLLRAPQQPNQSGVPCCCDETPSFTYCMLLVASETAGPRSPLSISSANMYS